MFYLPLPSDQADRLASVPTATDYFPSSSLLEAAAVLFVQNLPRQPASASAHAQERRFAEIVRIANQVERAARAASRARWRSISTARRSPWGWACWVRKGRPGVGRHRVPGQ